MKIALIGPTYPFRGGIAQHTTLLCNTLRKRHDVQFISYSRQYPRILFPGKSDRDPSVNALQSHPVEYLIDSINPVTWRRAAAAVVDFDPDRVIIPWWVIFWAPHMLYMIGKIRKHVDPKIILLCHNVSEHENNGIKKYITKNILKRADLIFTQSLQETEKVHSILKDKNINVITSFHPTYVDLCCNDYEKNKKNKEHVFELLFFGFVRKYKGLDILLDAMRIILDHMEVHLRVVGEFWKDKQEYLDKIIELDLQRYVEIVDDYVPNEELYRYFMPADLVVQPYTSASGSGVSQLAYGFAKPVVATKVGSIAEVVQDGVNGRLVEPNNPPALALAIMESLIPENLQRMHHEAGKVKDRFSWDRFSDMITEP